MSTILESIIDRMATCWREISPISEVYAGAPSMPINDDNLPAVALLVGRNTSASYTRGTTQTSRAFIARVFIAPIHQGHDTAYLGASKYREGIPIIDYAYQYFTNHPQLQTDAGDTGLGGVASAYIVSDSGIVRGASPGGAPYWVINFNHEVAYFVEYCNPF